VTEAMKKIVSAAPAGKVRPVQPALDEEAQHDQRDRENPSIGEHIRDVKRWRCHGACPVGEFAARCAGAACQVNRIIGGSRLFIADNRISPDTDSALVLVEMIVDQFRHGS
jgi:hypothetical protein